VQPSRTISTTVGTDWMQHAACMDRHDLDWFDIDCGAHQAVQLCHTCPVIERCLDYAITNQIEEGIWGGLWGRRLVSLVRGRGVGRG